jgi:hypothetical protein
MERVGGIEPPCAAWKAAVLPLNYTRKVGRAGRRPRAGRGEIRGIWGGLPPTATESSAVDRAAARAGLPAGVEPWRARRGRLVGEAGFEPAKAEPSDLQSDPFDRSGNSPLHSWWLPVTKAAVSRSSSHLPTNFGGQCLSRPAEGVAPKAIPQRFLREQPCCSLINHARALQTGLPRKRHPTDREVQLDHEWPNAPIPSELAAGVEPATC